MSKIELQRSHDGALHLVVDGRFAHGARVTSVQQIGDELGAVVFVPLRHATLGEVANVVPLVRPERAA